MTDPAVSFEPHRRRIRAIYSVRNPEKLSHVVPPV
jgi:hypothetical protein